MFNYFAQQIFVVQPYNAGGGILAFLLSLDTNTAGLDFQSKTLAAKLQDWNLFLSRSPGNAHCYGFTNFGHKLHTENIMSAEHCQRYIHKHHFYELDYANELKRNPLLDQIHGDKSAIGIYLTDTCVDAIKSLRPSTPDIDFHQRWIYNNQQKLLPDFFGINCLHTLPFCDLLNPGIFVDHLAYCKDILHMDTDVDLFTPIILQWYGMIGHSTGKK